MPAMARPTDASPLATIPLPPWKGCCMDGAEAEPGWLGVGGHIVLKARPAHPDKPFHFACGPPMRAVPAGRAPFLRGRQAMTDTPP
jgi:hypothetical protein